MRSAPALGQSGQALANFSQGQNAQIKNRFVGGFYPVDDTGSGPGFDKLRDAIGIEQESAHSAMSRPVSLSRSRSSLTPTSGDSRKNCTRLLGWREVTVRRWYSSSEIITTPSLPCRVIRCGPSVRANRNTSLKRALAV